MKCTRCNSILPEPKKDGWVNCPKCNLPRFFGGVKSVKEEVEVEKTSPKKKIKVKKESPQEVKEIEE